MAAPATVYDFQGVYERAGHIGITNGEAVSGEWVLGGHRSLALSVPTIDSAVITLDVKMGPADTFQALYDVAGTEVTIGGAANTGARSYANVVVPAGAYSFRLCTGTHASPVNQTSARTIPVHTAET